MNKHDYKRNLYMLKGNLSRNGYDWWWHSFTAKHEKTGEEQAFFIEYFIINPALSHDTIIFGENKQKPSYAMMKVGAWGKAAKQVHNFYPLSEVTINPDKLDISFGDCFLSETAIKGKCRVTPEESKDNPQWFSDSGDMAWDLKVSKKIAYHVGYGASPFFRSIQAFEMFWHAEGIKTEYEGTVIWQGDVYKVTPEASYGYADKNWGKNFTSPWLWISSCNLWSERYQKELSQSALEVGGGQPKIFGFPLKKKLLMGLHYEGIDYSYNFSEFWKKSHIDFEFIESSPLNTWNITATNANSKIIMTITCQQSDMLFIRYESPDGNMRHKRLWNGGNATGTLQLFHLKNHEETLIDTLHIKNAGCEYGEYQ